MDHLVTLKIIVEKYHNNKTNIFCCFIEFRKYFDTFSSSNIWNKLEELKSRSEFRAAMISLYEHWEHSRLVGRN